MRPFTEAEARDLCAAITGAAAREGGRRFVVTVQTADGRSITGHIVSTQEPQLELVVERPPDNVGEQVAWDEIASVRVHAE